MPTPESIRIVSVVAVVVLLFWGIKRPVFAGISYLVLDYCKVSHYYPGFAQIKGELVLGILILLGVLVSGKLRNKLFLPYTRLNSYLLFFIISMFVSFAVAIDHQHSWDNEVYAFIRVLIQYAIILGTLDDEKDIKIFAWAFVIMYAFLAYEPTYGFLYGVDPNKQMYGDIYVGQVGILSGHVALANNMNQMIPIAIFLIPTVKNKALKLLALIPLLIFVTALIGSGSRGGVIGFIGVIAALIYFSKQRLRNAVILMIVLAMFFGLSSMFRSTAMRIDQDQTEGRLMGIIHALEMIRVKGHIFGVGPGCYMIARGRYFGHTMMSHNIYGEVIGDLGIPGTIAWAFLILEIFKNFAKAKRKLMSLPMKDSFLYKVTVGLQISLIVRLFISLGSHGLYYIYWYLIAALSIAILRVVEGVRENEERKATGAVTPSGGCEDNVEEGGGG
jgi:O-antigen ligase